MARDHFGRRIDYLRISVTDRCNLRCRYCMPPEGVEWKPPADILPFELIERFAAIAVGEGISKIRLTGGEPLVRKGLVEHVARLREITGLEAIALTTNGILLPRYAAELAEAGLTRVNISLDTLDAETYRDMTRGGDLGQALEGIEAAFEAGFSPVKLNAVVVRSLDQDLLGFARRTLERPIHIRFIEYMPIGAETPQPGGCGPESTVGETGWTPADHVPSDEILERLSAEGAAAGLGELQPVMAEDAPGGWGPARYYRFPGAPGTVGVISPLSHHFCGECNRLRLTADGKLRPCLFSDEEIDVRHVLESGTDDEVRAIIERSLHDKPENHAARIGTLRRMSQIGG